MTSPTPSESPSELALIVTGEEKAELLLLGPATARSRRPGPAFEDSMIVADEAAANQVDSQHYGGKVWGDAFARPWS